MVRVWVHHLFVAALYNCQEAVTYRLYMTFTPLCYLVRSGQNGPPSTPLASPKVESRPDLSSSSVLGPMSYFSNTNTVSYTKRYSFDYLSSLYAEIAVVLGKGAGRPVHSTQRSRWRPIHIPQQSTDELKGLLLQRHQR